MHLTTVSDSPATQTSTLFDSPSPSPISPSTPPEHAFTAERCEDSGEGYEYGHGYRKKRTRKSDAVQRHFAQLYEPSQLQEVNDLLEMGWNCAICLDTADDPCVTRCGHMYCREHISECLAKSPSCPVCHTPCTPSLDILPVFSRDDPEEGDASTSCEALSPSPGMNLGADMTEGLLSAEFSRVAVARDYFSANTRGKMAAKRRTRTNSFSEPETFSSGQSRMRQVSRLPSSHNTRVTSKYSKSYTFPIPSLSLPVRLPFTRRSTSSSSSSNASSEQSSSPSILIEQPKFKNARKLSTCSGSETRSDSLARHHYLHPALSHSISPSSLSASEQNKQNVVSYVVRYNLGIILRIVALALLAYLLPKGLWRRASAGDRVGSDDLGVGAV